MKVPVVNEDFLKIKYERTFSYYDAKLYTTSMKFLFVLFSIVVFGLPLPVKYIVVRFSCFGSVPKM